MGGGAWWAGDVGWRAGEAVLEWVGAGQSVLRLGGGIAFAVGEEERRCVGVWRGGRRAVCTRGGAALAADARSGLCAACAALDRADSIATDTRPHDPRPFAVYLAHHGPVVKVGITAVERGDARLTEQGAFASVFVSEGTLMSARRSEQLLGAALGLPDRVSTARKRRARYLPGTAAGRAAELLDVVERVRGVPGWPPEGQRAREVRVVDHAQAYGLAPEGVHPYAAVAPLRSGDVVAGRVVCRIGADLYLAAPGAAGPLLLDGRLLAGWRLCPAPGAARCTAELIPLPPAHPPLF